MGGVKKKMNIPVIRITGTDKNDTGILISVAIVNGVNPPILKPMGLVMWDKDGHFSLVDLNTDVRGYGNDD